MQKCTVTVRLAGSLNNTVVKQDVTPAEIIILKHIHGDDAVVDIRPTDFDDTVLSAHEFERLKAFYDAAAGGLGGSPDADEKSVMGTLFPGALTKLPKLLSEIGIEGLDPELEAPRKRAPRATKAETPVVTPPAEKAGEAGAGEGEGDDDTSDENATVDEKDA